MALREEITRNNFKELNQRYSGTFGFMPLKDGRRKAVKISEIGPGWALVFDSGGNEYRLNTNAGNILEFTQVRNGWYLIHPSKAVYVCRIPERQWKRGICYENTEIITFDSNGSLIQDDWGAGTIQQLFYRDNSYEFEDTGIKCQVLNHFFAIGMDKLYVKNKYIGTYDGTNVKLELPLVKQELQDAFHRNNIAAIIQ